MASDAKMALSGGNDAGSLPEKGGGSGELSSGGWSRFKAAFWTSFEPYGIGTFSAVAVGCVLFFLLFLSATKYSLTLLCGAIAMALGWWIGTLLSPIGVEERAYASKVAKFVSTFITGLSVGKWSAIQKVVADHGGDDTALLRGGIFVGSFLTMTGVTFLTRRALQDAKDEKAREAELEALRKGLAEVQAQNAVLQQKASVQQANPAPA
jgi:hypothetical protein